MTWTPANPGRRLDLLVKIENRILNGYRMKESAAKGLHIVWTWLPAT